MARKVGVHLAAGTDADFRPQICLDLEGGVDQQVLGAGPFANDVERVVALVDKLAGIAVGPLKGDVFPAGATAGTKGFGGTNFRSPAVAYCGAVQKGIAVAEVVEQSLYGRAQQLVYGRFVLLFLDGWFIHVNEGMARIVFKHQPRFCHFFLSFQVANCPGQLKIQNKQNTRQLKIIIPDFAAPGRKGPSKREFLLLAKLRD